VKLCVQETGCATTTLQTAYGYCRQSTAKQERSGLGIQAQEDAIRQFADKESIQLLDVVVETESGSVNDRPVLTTLLERAKRDNSYVIVSKLDRLSRKVSFVAALMDRGVPFITVETGMSVEPFLLHIYAAFAEMERERIRVRTAEALKKAKSRGVKLGNPNWRNALVSACDGNRKGADEFAGDIYPIIQEIRSAGLTSFTAIAQALNARGIKTRRGRSWHPTTVKRLIGRAES